MILRWDLSAIDDLEAIRRRAPLQARAVVESVGRMASTGFSLGKRTNREDIRYWPVPPLGVLYTVTGEGILVLQVVDVRRLTQLP